MSSEEKKKVLINKNSGVQEDILGSVEAENHIIFTTPTISVRFEKVEGGISNDFFIVAEEGINPAQEVTQESLKEENIAIDEQVEAIVTE
jgi:hypothetical protein